MVDLRRVVITGMGVVAPNGSTLETFWKSICEGESSSRPLTRFPVEGLPSTLACEIPAFDPFAYMETRSAKRLERTQQLGVAASALAVIDAGIDFTKIDADRCGIVEASSLSNIDAAYKGKEAYATRGYRAISPTNMVNGYLGSGSAEIATRLGIHGHAITCSSSSSSGNDVMGYALNMIQAEEIDVMVAGGAEAPLIDTVYVGFSQMRAMTRWQGNAGEAMKPFDADADGFVMGEGSAYVVLEELSHALSRGARIYAELAGHGRSCEAYHAMAPHPAGEGVKRAIEKCLRRSQIDISEIDYINPHGSANPANDLAESVAIQMAFGRESFRIGVSSTKPVTGHCLAAVGALETVVCALAIEQAVIPLTLNHKHPLPGCDLDYVMNSSREYPVRAALSLNSGFGGKTSCLALRRFIK